MTKDLSNGSDQKKSLTDSSSEKEASIKPAVKQPVKPPKPEEKPFEMFINQDLIPGIRKAINEKGLQVGEVSLNNGPIAGITSWNIMCSLENGRRFWLIFSKNNIASTKSITLADSGCEPSLIEPFLIDERKTTLVLLISRILQRLNGQKWLGEN